MSGEDDYQSKSGGLGYNSYNYNQSNQQRNNRFSQHSKYSNNARNDNQSTYGNSGSSNYTSYRSNNRNQQYNSSLSSQDNYSDYNTPYESNYNSNTNYQNNKNNNFSYQKIKFQLATASDDADTEATTENVEVALDDLKNVAIMDKKENIEKELDCWSDDSMKEEEEFQTQDYLSGNNNDVSTESYMREEYVEKSKKVKKSLEKAQSKGFSQEFYLIEKWLYMYNECLKNFVLDPTIAETDLEPSSQKIRTATKKLCGRFNLVCKAKGEKDQKYLRVSKTKSTQIPNNYPDVVRDVMQEISDTKIGKNEKRKEKLERQLEEFDEGDIPGDWLEHAGLGLKKKTKYKPKIVGENAVAIDENSVGYKLLLKSGWKPGLGLGAESGGSKDIIQVKIRGQRTGLGID